MPRGGEGCGGGHDLFCSCIVRAASGAAGALQEKMGGLDFWVGDWAVPILHQKRVAARKLVVGPVVSM